MRCGSTDTKSGKPCGQICLPCKYHDEKKQRKAKQHTLPAQNRRKIIAEQIAHGSTPKQAALAAGLKPDSDEIYKIIAEPDTQQMIADRIQDAHSLGKDEIIGTLTAHMRGDLYYVMPENEILARAHERGVSHLVKEVEQKTRKISQGTGRAPIIETTTKVKIHNPQEATKQLAKVLSMEGMQLPRVTRKRTIEEMLDRIMDRANAAGVKVTEELRAEYRARLEKMEASQP